MNRLIRSQHGANHIALTLILALITCIFSINNSTAANLSLSSVPMDVQQGVPPNILLTVDTSGSMKLFYLPDKDAEATPTGYGDTGILARDANSDFNKVYYNPNITYKQAVDANGAPLANGPTFASAWRDGFDHAACDGTAVDLNNYFTVAWGQNDGCNLGTSAAYYYVKTNDPACSYPSATNSCYTKITLDSSFTAFPTPSTRTDCTGNGGTTCTLADEKQNFANWYSYYRSRILLAKSTISIAFSQLSNNVRVTQQTLQTSQIGAVRVFSGADRDSFFSTLQGLSASGATPMRTAFSRAGEFFSEPAGSIYDPYVNNPGPNVTQSATSEYACRQNFNISITDGMWNLGDPSPDPGDADSNPVTLPTATLGVSKSYTPQLPYADGYKHASYPTTLADVAFYYWSHDLRTDLDNNVPTYLRDTNTDYNGDTIIDNTDAFLDPNNDPADWQHMVNFTIPLGLTGDLTYDSKYFNKPFDDPANSSFTHWPKITGVLTNEPSKVDDLWHAAINSRGGFYTASDPNTLTKAISNVLNSIASRTGSASAVATTTSTYASGNTLFQSIYDTSDWHGDLIAYDVTDTSTPLWNAKDVLNKQNNNGAGRTIITYNPATGKGIPFEWSSLSANQQALLNNNSDVLSYLRGDQSKEQSNGGSFRNRAYILGDLVDSAPVYIGPPDRFFPDTMENKPYSAFVTTYQDRTPMVCVGANDGMLHCFDASTKTSSSGSELLSYVPSSVYTNLASLSDPSYTHKFFVDGSPISRDVFFNNAWHTVLVGGLNGGGQGIYALDITDPSKFNETNAANQVLWEFTDADDPNMGYTYSTPSVGKMNSKTSQWAAIFGNGYNNTASDANVSSTGDAYLYIVDIATGAVIRKFDTGVGSAQDPTNQNRPNGLSSVAVVDVNGDYKIDYIYAGDLFGNLWKFDVREDDPSLWSISRAVTGGPPTPLFKAEYTDSNGVIHYQPITTAPVVSRHPTFPGFIVNFGTGKYLEKSDLTDVNMQSFYGIWDRNEPIDSITTMDPSALFQQQILSTNTSQFTGNYARITSADTFNWYISATGSGLPPAPTTSGPNYYLGWYMNLVDSGSAPQGERVIADPTLIGNRIIFVTNTPSPDPCMVGGSSWIMELSASTGMRLNTMTFDYNDSGIVDAADMVKYNSNLVVGSGIQSQNGGKLSGLNVIYDPKTHNEVKLSSTSKGTVKKRIEYGSQDATGRRAWVEPNLP